MIQETSEIIPAPIPVSSWGESCRGVPQQDDSCKARSLRVESCLNRGQNIYLDTRQEFKSLQIQNVPNSKSNIKKNPWFRQISD